MKIKQILKRIFSRNAIFILMLLFQITFLVFAIAFIGEKFYFVYLFLMVLDIIIVIYIMNKSDNPSYKLSWIIAMSVFPLLGGIAYVFIKQSQKFPRNIGRVYQMHAENYLVQNNDVLDALERQSQNNANLARYVIRYGHYPVYQGTTTHYFPLGELQFESMINELNSAKHFIFMEFFIISDGYMFNTISEILIKKADDGLDVRLMYDGIGTGMLSIPSDVFKKMKEHGVKCKVFNPFTPFLSSVQNNRDHRKTIVIDGHTAFNGGTNLADEYINRIERFGHWKDTAIMVKGEAVWNYTVMFLQLWEIGEKNKFNYEQFLPVESELFSQPSDGFVQPFSDSPLDNEQVGKMVYMDLINNSCRYVYITTPYLILDHEVLTALQLAAKKGVDVRIITPHIPDKWYVHHIAWNTYPELIEAGVRIFEYTPGFIHAKSCISDGNTAVIGTINLDYRSLYLHFESASILYKCSVIDDMKRDFDETLELSQEITLEDCKNRPILKKISGCILKMFAPLL